MLPLVVDGLVRAYDGRRAVDGATFTVQAGEVVGFLGANGAGKTTTLRCCAGLLDVQAGSVLVAGHDVRFAPRAAKAALGFVPDRPFLYDRLTAREFLAFVAALYELPAEASRHRAGELFERLHLGPEADDTIESYSLGMRQKTAIAAAMLHAPALLMLDEPLGGLDPPAARALRTLLREHAAGGAGVLVSTHLLDVAERFCDRVVILKRGRVLAAGTLAELRGARTEASLEDVFLGLASDGLEP